MALITSTNIRRIEKQRYSIHEKVDCTYSVLINNSGQKFLQLDTYGSNERKIKDKISQSLQFNQESAKEIYNILKKEFDFS